MWMVAPEVMCRQHLLGEHVELHMLLGHLRRGRHVRGFVDKNCIEVMALESRHEALVDEMTRRGYRHESPLEVQTTDLKHLSDKERWAVVDQSVAHKDLLARCSSCRDRAAMKQRCHVAAVCRDYVGGE